AAEQVVERAFRSPDIRRRLLGPPAADVVPYGGRGLLPVRDEARKTLRLSAAPPDPAQQELDRAGEVLRAFTDRAWRRPVTYDELARLLRFVEASQKAGEGVEPGLRLALQAVLASPHFLFKVEREAAAAGPGVAHPVNGFELATRLSYLLWS